MSVTSPKDLRIQSEFNPKDKRGFLVKNIFFIVNL